MTTMMMMASAVVGEDVAALIGLPVWFEGH